MESVGPQPDDSAMNLAALIIGLTVLLVALCCGPLCCICYAALQYQSLREKTLQERSTSFAVQWRSQNPIKPFGNPTEWVAKGWEAWHFKFSPLPKMFNGLSTETFQSPEPVLALNSHNLQEINFNPGIGPTRKPQSVQCNLPMMQYESDEEMGTQFRPGCYYFELSIVSYRAPGGRKKKKKKKKKGRFEGNVAIGLACRPCPPFRMPGHDPISVGFHSRGGEIFMGAGECYSFGNPWNTIGSTVGCGYDVSQGVPRVFFSHNGGPPMLTTFAVPDNVSAYLFPTIGADCDVTVVVNMGQQSFHCNGLPVVMNSMRGINGFALGAILEQETLSIEEEEEEGAASGSSSPACNVSKEQKISYHVNREIQTDLSSCESILDRREQPCSTSYMEKEGAK